MSSTRLPGKVLKDIGGKPLIEFLIDRVNKSKRISASVVACTSNSRDDVLENYLIKKGHKCFRGDEKNVLKRFYDCASEERADLIIRITADCPFIDPELIDECVKAALVKKCDYVSNTQDRTYPDGLDIAVFTFSLLKEAYLNSNSNFEREHVTPYMKANESINKYNLKNSVDYSKIRITVDEEVDLKVIREIQSRIGGYDFSWKEIIRLFQIKPEIFEMNANITRNEGSKMKETMKLWKRAKSIIPGGNHLLSKRPEQFAPDLWPAYYEKAKGCTVWDLEKNKYIDLSIMGVGTNILGYSNSEVDSAVIKNIKKGNMSTLNCPEEVKLADKLLEINDWADMVRFARTGGEANAIAIRIARAATGRSKIAICGYHGWHDWYLSANLESESNLGDLHLKGFYTAGVPKELEGTTQPFRYNDLDKLKQIIKEHKLAAIKMEVMRNEEPQKGFLEAVRKLADENNIVLIFDECTSGFRETFGGLHKKYAVYPDIAIYGKAMGNGYAITSVVGKRDIMDHAQETFISSTFWTERAGPTAALKTLELMERNQSWKYISNLGDYINQGWKKIADRNGLDIHIFGLNSITKYVLRTKNEFLKYKTFITQEMLKRGYLATNSVYVSTAHNKELVDKYIGHLDEIFSQIKRCENEDMDINDLLESKICHSEFKRLN